eukprot:CAMPEP_0115041146 /NCGR_PEP_ID=MMETSP0216-20121206/45332_1 /TAXON_ID=223996 /ORGANISM="Protocruzia adherens, Strain Boccale" /LENGTH=304 /DNA_ID=CAMNT_0002422685 /DNA_START=358 /DNA_END=1268 /DNA_ORIENTATION=+
MSSGLRISSTNSNSKHSRVVTKDAQLQQRYCNYEDRDSNNEVATTVMKRREGKDKSKGRKKTSTGSLSPKNRESATSATTATSNTICDTIFNDSLRFESCKVTLWSRDAVANKLYIKTEKFLPALSLSEGVLENLWTIGNSMDSNSSVITGYMLGQMTQGMVYNVDQCKWTTKSSKSFNEGTDLFIKVTPQKSLFKLKTTSSHLALPEYEFREFYSRTSQKDEKILSMGLKKETTSNSTGESGDKTAKLLAAALEADTNNFFNYSLAFTVDANSHKIFLRCYMMFPNIAFECVPISALKVVSTT